MSESKEDYLEDAIRCYKAGHYTEALLACDNAIQQDVTYARAYHGRGLILIRQKYYKKALESFQKACQLAPENAKLYADMGELFFLVANFKEACQSYKMAIQLDKKYEAIYHKKNKGTHP